MKNNRTKLILFAWIALCYFSFFNSASAQIPQAISYQAVARNNSGAILSNQLISLRFTIRDNTSGGTIVYRETQNLTTSAIGSFSVNIGQGTVVQGTFSTINWAVNNKFLQVEMDATGGSVFLDLGTQQMLSVPYALFSGSSGGGWGLTGNSGTVDGTNFIGTTDNIPLNLKVGNVKAGRIDKNQFNAFYGGLSGNAITTGTSNSGFGHSALTGVTIGTANTGVGTYALQSLAGGQYATAVGYESQQYINNSGTLYNSWNTSIGAFSLQGSNTASDNTGIFNTAIGAQALSHNTSGGYGTAIGMGALVLNTTGNFNTATGKDALNSNTTGSSNSAYGYECLYSNVSGIRNAAFGEKTLHECTGLDNTAFGSDALNLTTTANYNTAIGAFAGAIRDNGGFNTFLGHSAIATANGFTNSTAVGDNSSISASNQVRIGNGSVTSIGGQVGWTTLSDARFKRNIKSNVHGLDFILQLNPVTYTLDVNSINKFIRRDEINNATETEYTEEEKTIIAKSIEQKEQVVYSGFLAQDVDMLAKKIGYDFSGIDAPKNEGDYFGLRYGDFVVPLVKAIQEQQIIIENQSQMLELVQASNAKLLEETTFLKSEIEKIKAELGLDKTVMK